MWDPNPWACLIFEISFNFIIIFRYAKVLYTPCKESRVGIIRISTFGPSADTAYTRARRTVRSGCVVGGVVALSLVLAAIHENAALADIPYSPNVPDLSEDRSVRRGTASTPSNASSNPPFRGTVFIDPDIVTPSDPSSLLDVTCTGRCGRRGGDLRHRRYGWAIRAPDSRSRGRTPGELQLP